MLKEGRQNRDNSVTLMIYYFRMFSHIMEDAKEIERSLWSGVGASVSSHEVVGAKGGVVDVAVGERAVVLPAERVVPVEGEGGGGRTRCGGEIDI